MTKNEETWQVDGRSLTVSHLQKTFWPEDGLSKGEMLAYYRQMAPLMLPYFQDRPVTARVFPNGIHGFSYYRRDLPDNAPDWLRYADYEPVTTGKTIQVPLIDDAAGLLWLANQGGIEFHLWAARLPNLAEPDMAIFDLDVGAKADFGDVLQAALRLREALTAVNLQSYAKTSGGTGLHVYVPLSPGYTFDFVREWVKGIAIQLEAAHPDLMAVAHGRTHEGQTVTIDYAQNSIGRNTAAPYTLRARPGAPVSAPLTWEEVADGRITPADFNIHTMPQRTADHGDLFLPVLTEKQSIPEGTLSQ